MVDGGLRRAVAETWRRLTRTSSSSSPSRGSSMQQRGLLLPRRLPWAGDDGGRSRRTWAAKKGALGREEDGEKDGAEGERRA
jgi:hypothetical protein